VVKSFFEVLGYICCMAKKPTPSPSDLLQELIKIHVPASYLAHFDLHEVKDKPDCYELVLHEKEDKIPGVLQGKEVVLDGYCNPIQILTQSFSLKRIYLVIKRRRWKEPGGDIHYSNEYDLHPKGAKVTPQFAAFLKEVDRALPHQY
jgi:hypothetical protein